MEVSHEHICGHNSGQFGDTDNSDNSGDTILIFSSSFNIKLNITPQNSKTASEFSKVSPEYLVTI